MKKDYLLFCMLLLFTSCGQIKKDNEPVVSVDTTEPTCTPAKVVEIVDTISCKLTIFKGNDIELIIERDSLWNSYCYAVKDGLKRKIVFGQEYIDDGAAELTYYAYDRCLYIVGDIKPNSNGWTSRYSLYRIDKGDFSLKFIYAGAAIHFTPHEIIVAEARLTNPDADCTANEIWVMHDVHFDVNGNKIREDKQEYNYERMEQKFGTGFVNTIGLISKAMDEV